MFWGLLSTGTPKFGSTGTRRVLLASSTGCAMRLAGALRAIAGKTGEGRCHHYSPRARPRSMQGNKREWKGGVTTTCEPIGARTLIIRALAKAFALV
ncbi:hypothetical protein KC323_g119 [Hortaea werneckii]|nr:hypothetical protein KC323_g119 [Hortaea werneckii]